MKIGNLEVYGVIYKITNKVNGKVYIGRATRGFKRRYSGDLYKYTKNNHLKNAIKKYGIDMFEVIPVLDIAFSNYELNIKEQLYICIYNSFYGGYNQTKGGDGQVGRTHTEQYRKQLREKWLGDNNPMKSIEIRDKVSRARAGKYTGSANPKARSVICLNNGRRFSTVTEATKWAGLVGTSSIGYVCRGIKKTASKHPVTGERLRWAYYDEWLKQQGA